MAFHRVVLTILFLFAVSLNNCNAQNNPLTMMSGKLHMKGRLTEGGCTVSSENQDMHIDMGTAYSFSGLGSQQSNIIPFFIRLTGCDLLFAEGAEIKFSGIATPKEPDVFLVTSAENMPEGNSNIGLLVTDTKGNQVIPGKAPDVNEHGEAVNEMKLHYFARYRAISDRIFPGPLRSEVWFNISYP